ncbi:hypothetical protein PanWU01x14_244490 [Parasponia andersonii]|uniref:Uncharacterized protein n=1 Tax=Parasponia andersonii TaxID=3476 RepID=A0A2P5BF00_PARAD|nr:hypothetical protein PanWU01x14_244490 [Parasponia andersonii]
MLFHFLLHFLVALLSATADRGASSGILFSTFDRLAYAFDIFSLPIIELPPTISEEIQLTDGESINFNVPPLQLVYVTERDGGLPNLYYDVVFSDSETPDAPNARRRSALRVSSRVQVPLLDKELIKDKISMKDRPSLAGDYLVYVSTHEKTGEPRSNWAAVYSTELKSGVTQRLTPYGLVDFSLAVSPFGTWMAVVSYGAEGWDGETEDLNESTLYLHRRGGDQWWSIYRAILPSSGRTFSVDSVLIERVTPPHLHAFTPATSPGNKKFIAVATKRPNSGFRHI